MVGEAVINDMKTKRSLKLRKPGEPRQRRDDEFRGAVKNENFLKPPSKCSFLLTFITQSQMSTKATS